MATLGPTIQTLRILMPKVQLHTHRRVNLATHISPTFSHKSFRNDDCITSHKQQEEEG